MKRILALSAPRSLEAVAKWLSGAKTAIGRKNGYRATEGIEAALPASVTGALRKPAYIAGRTG